MNGKEQKRQKQQKSSYGIWVGLLCKRLWKQPAYVCLLLAVPLLGFAVSRIDTDGRQGAVAAVFIENGSWSRQIEDMLGVSPGETWQGMIQFQLCDSDIEVQRQVARGKADCGFVIPEDIQSHVMEKDWNRRIVCYESANSSIAGMVKERLAAVIFQLYSEEKFDGYMAKQAEFYDSVTADGTEMAAFAKEAYERRLVDGSTFSIQYHEVWEEENSYDHAGQKISDISVINDTDVFPVKGVFAVLIFISGMCGMLEYEKDKKEKRFIRMAPNWMTYLVNIWVSTVFPSLAVLLCLWLMDFPTDNTGGLVDGGAANGSLAVWSMETWVRQAGLLLAYQFVILLYCGILRLVLRSREAIAAAVPVLTLGCLVCSPVFVRLAAFAPLFWMLEKLFPATYYLIW